MLWILAGAAGLILVIIVIWLLRSMDQQLQEVKNSLDECLERVQEDKRPRLSERS
ncbi:MULTISPECIES: hypothetical protein [Carboxydocella]|uniref:hypothetical protein n=1 Tax=Carboxydocella TaxID=178898 RepID=UPI00131B9D01|nr:MULTISPECIES: hypothetical protein [Carboxydocella]